MRYLLLFLGLFLFGCALTNNRSTHYAVVVDALTDGRAQVSTVQLINITEASHLEKKYYDDYVRAAMTAVGYKVVETRESADLVVLYSYGLSSREKIASRPTYSWTAPKQYNYTNSSYGSTGSTFSSGTVSEGGFGTLQRTGNEVYTYDEHTRMVYFEAFLKNDIEPALKVNKKPLETWKLTLASSGYSANMRKAFPFLLSAALEFFNTDSVGPQRRYVYRTHEALTKAYLGTPEVREPAKTK